MFALVIFVAQQGVDVTNPFSWALYGGAVGTLLLVLWAIMGGKLHTGQEIEVWKYVVAEQSKQIATLIPATERLSTMVERLLEDASREKQQR